MAGEQSESKIDPRNGYCSGGKTFHSLRPAAPLPPLSKPLSVADYVISLLGSSPGFSPDTTSFLVEAESDRRLSYSDFISQSLSLSSSLRSLFPSLSKNQAAFIVSPSSLHIPAIYFSLLSLGVTISPANPLSTDSELNQLIRLSNPVIAFATYSTAHKLPSLPLGTVIIDSPQFLSMLTSIPAGNCSVEVNQSDVAAILYSSGTTGRVKGVELTHRNLIAIVAGSHHRRFIRGANDPPPSDPISLSPLPLFHVFGFMMMLRVASVGETLVLMQRFDFEKMLAAVEKHRVKFMPVSPPLVVAMAKSELVKKYDLSSLSLVGCGGAPLGKEVAEAFTRRFPNTVIAQGYGMTETGGGAAEMETANESERYGSAGRLSSNLEAKIVDPATGNALPPLHRGELWIRGPIVMKGYIGDKDATGATLDAEGWLKTGDLCYFDNDGFLYVVDRLKELIKYKAYQVPPAELEHVLQAMPEIADAAVIPYPEEEAGQIPMAYVVRKPGTNVTESQVMDFVAKQVSPYKKIRRVAFINAIPKTPAGKILRRDLVNRALSAASSRL